MGTPDQQRRAWQIVGQTLGLYAIVTPRDDKGARFGYECALLAIIQGDEALEQSEKEFDRAATAAGWVSLQSDRPEPVEWR